MNHPDNVFIGQTRGYYLLSTSIRQSHSPHIKTYAVKDQATFLFTEQLNHADATPSNKRQVLITFLLALNQEYKQHRAVQYYAAKQGLSPRHFADIVKQESGYTPMEWINMVTINQAKHLLRQPNMLVKQVADELGFPEQFTFRKYFKTNTGISPTEYSKKLTRI